MIQQNLLKLKRMERNVRTENEMSESSEFKLNI